MNIVKVNDDLTEIDGNVRVERGPAKKAGKATEALLSNDKTAAHYQLGARDADGYLIEAGKPMAYLDWLGTKGFYVYLRTAAPTAERPDGTWAEDSFHSEEGPAMARAGELASA